MTDVQWRCARVQTRTYRTPRTSTPRHLARASGARHVKSSFGIANVARAHTRAPRPATRGATPHIKPTSKCNPTHVPAVLSTQDVRAREGDAGPHSRLAGNVRGGVLFGLRKRLRFDGDHVIKSRSERVAALLLLPVCSICRRRHVPQRRRWRREADARCVARPHCRTSGFSSRRAGGVDRTRAGACGELERPSIEHGSSIRAPPARCPVPRQRLTSKATRLVLPRGCTRRKLERSRRATLLLVPGRRRRRLAARRGRRRRLAQTRGRRPCGRRRLRRSQFTLRHEMPRAAWCRLARRASVRYR